MPIGQIVKHNLEIIEDARNRQGMLSGLPTGLHGARPDDIGPSVDGPDHRWPPARRSERPPSPSTSRSTSRSARGAPWASSRSKCRRSSSGSACSARRRTWTPKKVRDGYASKEAIGRLVLAQSKIAGANFFFDDGAGLSVPDMRAKAQRLKREKGLDLIVVDYLQLMAGHGRFDNRTQEVSQISRGLKLLAKELHVPILALSQLSRSAGTSARATSGSPSWRTCGTRARSSRTRTSSSSSTARSSTTGTRSARESPT